MNLFAEFYLTVNSNLIIFKNFSKNEQKVLITPKTLIKRSKNNPPYG
jgi:hypothetical protein